VKPYGGGPVCGPSGLTVRSCKASDLCDCFDWPEYDDDLASTPAPEGEA
jgi:hypothetical protein